MIKLQDIKEHLLKELKGTKWDRYFAPQQILRAFNDYVCPQLEGSNVDNWFSVSRSSLTTFIIDYKNCGVILTIKIKRHKNAFNDFDLTFSHSSDTLEEEMNILKEKMNTFKEFKEWAVKCNKEVEDQARLVIKELKEKGFNYHQIKRIIEIGNAYFHSLYEEAE